MCVCVCVERRLQSSRVEKESMYAINKAVTLKLNSAVASVLETWDGLFFLTLTHSFAHSLTLQCKINKYNGNTATRIERSLICTLYEYIYIYIYQLMHTRFFFLFACWLSYIFHTVIDSHFFTPYRSEELSLKSNSFSACCICC